MGWWHCQTVQLSQHGLAVVVLWRDWPELPCFSGKDGGSALQAFGMVCMCPHMMNNFSQRVEALHISCIVSALHSSENCAKLQLKCELSMPMSRLQLPMHVDMGLHALPMELGRLMG